MIFFLQTAILPDANAAVDYVIVVNGESTIDFPELPNLEASLSGQKHIIPGCGVSTSNLVQLFGLRKLLGTFVV